MKCEVCKTSMDLLFNHWSCPYCQPPGTPHHRSTKAPNPQFYYWTLVWNNQVLKRHSDSSFDVGMTFSYINYTADKDAAIRQINSYKKTFKDPMMLSIVSVSQKQIDASWESDYGPDWRSTFAPTDVIKMHLPLMAQTLGIES